MCKSSKETEQKVPWFVTACPTHAGHPSSLQKEYKTESPSCHPSNPSNLGLGEMLNLLKLAGVLLVLFLALSVYPSLICLF